MNCCAFLSEHEVVGGTKDGCLWILDVRSPRWVVKRDEGYRLITIEKRGV